MTSDDAGMTLRCGNCGNSLSISPGHDDQHVLCPHCQNVLRVPRSLSHLHEEAEQTLVVDAPQSRDRESTSNGSSAKLTFPQAKRVGDTGSNPDATWITPPGEPLPSSGVAEAAVLGADVGGPSAPGSNPFGQWSDSPSGASMTFPAGSNERRVRRRLPLSYWVLTFLVPYSLAATVGLIVTLGNRPPHPLEVVQDQGLYEELEEGRRRTVIEPNQPLPADAKPLRLGETRRIGALEVTPVKVHRQKVRFSSFRGSRDYESLEEGLYLTLHLKNVGMTVFQPLDPTFNRAYRRDAAPYTFLTIGNTEYYGPITDVATERVQGQRLSELQPGDEMDTVVVALHEAQPGQPTAAKALKSHPSELPLVWRVQLRRGREEVVLKDGRRRTVWATTVIPITFVAKDVREQP